MKSTKTKFGATAAAAFLLLGRNPFLLAVEAKLSSPSSATLATAGGATAVPPIGGGGQCPPSVSDAACVQWTKLRDGYAELFGVPPGEAAPESWAYNVTLDGIGGGLGPHGPFSYTLVEASGMPPEAVERAIVDAGGSADDWDGVADHGVSFLAGKLLLEAGGETWGPVGGIAFAFDPSDPPPGADPAMPVKFVAGYVEDDGDAGRRELVACSTARDAYSCPAYTLPSCRPSCAQDPALGKRLDGECYSTQAKIHCNTYKTNMANECRTYNSDMAGCKATHDAAQITAGILYAAAIMICAGIGIFSLGFGTAGCLFAAQQGYIAGVALIMVDYAVCKDNAAGSLVTRQINAKATLGTDMDNARIFCCTLPCPVPTKKPTRKGEEPTRPSDTGGRRG